MKRFPNWLIVLAILALLIALKFIFLPSEEAKLAASKSGAAAETPAVGVNYFVVKSTELNNDVFTTGKVGAFNEVELMPEMNGKVTAILFTEGQVVEKGAPLLKINDADLQAQQQKIQTQIRLAQQKLKRLEQLLKVSGISQEDYDIQQSELESLQSDAAYNAALIAKATLVAPFSGHAGLKNISVGAYVTTGSPVVALVQMKPVYIEFAVPEKYISLLKKGELVKFKTDKLVGEDRYEARIYAIEPKVDEATRTIRARAEYNGTATLYPGTYVNTYVSLAKTEDALMVPTQAVTATLKGQKVFLAKAGTAVEMPVKLGMRGDAMVQVTEGLQVGDTVLTTGLLSLRKDSKIKLIKTK